MNNKHMTKEKQLTIKDLEDQVLEEVKELVANEDITPEDKEDMLGEIADSNVPIYNQDLLEVAISDLWLALERTEYDSETAIDCIKEAIYRHLDEYARTEYERLTDTNQ